MKHDPIIPSAPVPPTVAADALRVRDGTAELLHHPHGWHDIFAERMAQIAAGHALQADLDRPMYRLPAFAEARARKAIERLRDSGDRLSMGQRPARHLRDRARRDLVVAGALILAALDVIDTTNALEDIAREEPLP